MIIVRVLGLEGLGAYAATGTFFTLLIVLLVWPTFGLSRYVTGYYQTGRYEEARGLYVRGLEMGLLISTATAIAFWYLPPSLSRMYYGVTGYAWLIKLMALDLAVNAYSNYAYVALQASMRFGRWGLVQALWALVRYGVGLALLFAGFGPAGLIAGWVAGDAVSAAFSTYWSLDFIIGNKAKAPLLPAISFAVPLAIGYYIATVLQNVDKLFVLKYIGLAEMGSYSVIMIGSAMLQTAVYNSLSNAIYPAFVKFEESSTLSGDAVAAAIRYVTVLTVPPFFLVAALGRPLIQLVLGPAFVHDWEAFAVLMVGHAAMNYDLPITQALQARKATKTLGAQAIVSAAVIAALSPPLIARWLVTGAAVAYVLARLVGFLGVAAPKARSLGLLKIDLREYAKTISAAIITFAVTLAAEVVTGFGLVLLPLYIALGGIAMVASLRVLRVLRADDYIALMEATPVSLRGLVARAWSLLGLPMPDPQRAQ
ncbi:MAG: oligosaccharide flippase family protein [Candidatus Nanopusillus sp.]|nr:oligosaccharide flippase family protein [Candidatus Nanopusillus sp.]